MHYMEQVLGDVHSNDHEFRWKAKDVPSPYTYIKIVHSILHTYVLYILFG